MTATALSSIASLCAQLHGADLHPWVRENARELIVSFALVESSGREHVMGDGGKSWGAFQFGMARWLESGGSVVEWGKADAKRQVEVMLRAFSNYCHKADARKDKLYLRFCAGSHNGWGNEAQRVLYFYEILKAWPTKKGKQ